MVAREDFGLLLWPAKALLVGLDFHPDVQTVVGRTDPDRARMCTCGMRDQGQGRRGGKDRRWSTGEVCWAERLYQGGRLLGRGWPCGDRHQKRGGEHESCSGVRPRRRMWHSVQPVCIWIV